VLSPDEREAAMRHAAASAMVSEVVSEVVSEIPDTRTPPLVNKRRQTPLPSTSPTATPSAREEHAPEPRDGARPRRSADAPVVVVNGTATATANGGSDGDTVDSERASPSPPNVDAEPRTPTTEELADGIRALRDGSGRPLRELAKRRGQPSVLGVMRGSHSEDIAEALRDTNARHGLANAVGYFLRRIEDLYGERRQRERAEHPTTTHADLMAALEREPEELARSDIEATVARVRASTANRPAPVLHEPVSDVSEPPTEREQNRLRWLGMARELDAGRTPVEAFALAAVEEEAVPFAVTGAG